MANHRKDRLNQHVGQHFKATLEIHRVQQVVVQKKVNKFVVRHTPLQYEVVLLLYACLASRMFHLIQFIFKKHTSKSFS